MDSLWKIAVALLLAYVLAIVIMRASSLVKAAITKAYHTIAGRGIEDPDVACEVDTTDGSPGQGLRILVGRSATCTLSSGEIRGQAAAMLKDTDKLTPRITELEEPDAPMRVLTFEYPAGPSLVTRGVYLDKARQVWEASQDGARLAANGYGTVTKYDGQRRWCIQYLVPKERTA